MKFQVSPQLSFWRKNRLPILLQTEAAECGLACISMIANYWGHAIDIASMRRRFSVSLKGVTLRALMTIAQGMNFNSRALKLDIQHIKDLKLPCILHWDFNHFVVLKSVALNIVVIHDPAAGERRLAVAEFAKHFTGVALELTPSESFKKQNGTKKFSLISLMGNISGLKYGLIQILILGISLQVCLLIAPFYLQWIVDEALVSSDRDLIKVLGLGFLALFFIQTAITAVRSWITTVLSTSINFQWFGNAFSHLMKLPLVYFTNRHTGDIVSRFGSIQTIQRGTTTQLVEGIIDGILVIGTLGMMYFYSVKLMMIACVTVVFYVTLRLVIFNQLRTATAEQIIHTAKQQTHFLESVRGVQSIRLFHRGSERRGGWMNILADQFNSELQIAKLSLSYQTANSLLFGAERIIIIWIAAVAVMDNEFSIGMVFAFLSYKDQFSQRSASLVDKVFELRMLKLHGERLSDILLTTPEQNDNESEIDLGKINPSIEFKNVSFRYSDAEPYVVKNLNLVIPAGQSVAITGISGCGKTTLVKLLLALIIPTEGKILIDGKDVQHLGLSNYRKIVGTVMQEDSLFSGSIGDNISFFDPSPVQSQIENCARFASVHEEISSMPMAYNTLVGDIGSGISGGQKQRLLLARALYKNPKILILDEATSHLDLNNEKAVNVAISDLSLTRIIVAHRPETIASAERIIVLHNGFIANDLIRNKI